MTTRIVHHTCGDPHCTDLDHLAPVRVPEHGEMRQELGAWTRSMEATRKITGGDA